MNCPRCGTELHQATSYAGVPSEYWLECDKCNTYVNTYVPQPHQESVHEDSHLYVGNFGAYGTGKTLTSREEIYKHLFITPNANVLICANIAAQYEQTIKRDIEQDIPKAFVKYVSVQKSYMDLINGARIMFRPLDDPDKLRSLNLTMFVIVEASEANGEAFHQLKTRLRNLAATTPLKDKDGNIVYRTLENGQKVPVIDKDWRRGIAESNPDSGWIRTDILYASDVIYKHGRVLDDYKVPDSAKDHVISTHVASTDVNAYLPPTFVEEVCKNKPTWWINRYIFGSFSYAEGLVYPSAMVCIETAFEVPKEWKRLVAADYGLSDDFVYLCAALDEMNGVVHVYRESRTNNRNIDELSKLFFETTEDIPQGGFYTQPILDPKSGAKRDYNKKTLYDHFLDHGIYFQPGAINVAARVYRTNTYLESGKLKIMDNCVGLINELRDYKFPTRTLANDLSKAIDKPEDKNNHGINPLEWICMALPDDPKKLYYGAYDRNSGDITKPRNYQDPYGVIDGVPYALRDDPVPEQNMYERMVW
jgi:hypothetical protein